MSTWTHFSTRASPMVVGLRVRAMGIWKGIEEQVHIHQKSTRYGPIDRLLACSDPRETSITA